MNCEHIGLMVLCRSPLPAVTHRPQSSMGTLDWLFAAAIGAGGSVLGGLVGGWFVLRAGAAQWQRDREASRADRSHQAALTIATEITGLEAAVETWGTRQEDVDALVAAFNAFSLSTTVQSMGLIDDELRRRINDHRLLTGKFAAIASAQGTIAGQSGNVETMSALAETVRRNTEAVLEAIDSHVTGKPLPPYDPPVVGAGIELLASQSSLDASTEGS